MCALQKLCWINPQLESEEHRFVCRVKRWASAFLMTIYACHGRTALHS